MNGLSGHIHCTSFQHRPFTHHGAVKQSIGRLQRFERDLSRQITCSGRQLGSQGGRDAYGRSSSEQGDSRLIIPGRGSSGQEDQRPQKLYTPGQAEPAKPSGGGAGLGSGLIGVEGKPTGNTFRPPPGFMDDAPEQEAAPSENPQVLLQRVRGGTGHWHELAKLLPILNASGYDGLLVEQEAGVERATQNKWTVSMHVYESLRRSEEFPKEKLSHFDGEGTEELLYEMRNLGIGLRAATAEYIVDNDLDPYEATTLSRAAKEHGRRGGEKEGFSVAPGDCLAFKYYRDAIECRSEDAKAALVKKGLNVAVTPEAAQKLRRLIEAPEEDEGAAPATAANLQTLRLTREEMGFKTVPLVSGLEAATVADLQALPEVRQSGSFSAFTLASTDPKQQWVGLPAWNILLLARKPFAVALHDCSAIPAVLSSANAKTPEEKAKLAGPGLLVCDSQPEEVSERHFYLVASDNGLQIVDGEHAKESGDTCAQILFLCRPPQALGASLASQTSHLLQV